MNKYQKRTVYSLGTAIRAFNDMLKYPQIVKHPKHVHKLVDHQNRLIAKSLYPSREQNFKSMMMTMSVSSRDYWQSFTDLDKISKKLNLHDFLIHSLRTYKYVSYGFQGLVQCVIMPSEYLGHSLWQSGCQFLAQKNKNAQLLRIKKLSNKNKPQYRLDYVNDKN